MKHFIAAALLMCSPAYAEEKPMFTYDAASGAYMVQYVPDAMIMSEWPLCMASMPDCSDCPVMIYTGIANCLGSKLGDLSRFYALRRSGAIDAETFSKKLTEGADWLEDEVLCGPWSYKKRIERNRK